ncbi:VanZ family protein [Streptomyces sp. NPDC005752]|uniref:VanZ family protein n=1 Tax=Streptomyces sp. NPDC005752 TaxID=3157065 RepID=UPI0033C31052
MLEAVFNGRGEFVLIAVVSVALAGLLSFLPAKRYTRRPWACAGLTAVVAAELSVTLLLASPGSVSGQCVINRDVGEPFATEQGLLNLVMFLPVGLFGVLAVRRVLPVFLGAALLSSVTELCQGLLPWLGRSCDTSDVQMNVLGAALGTLAGWAALHLTRRELHPVTAALRPTAIVFGAGFLACAAVGTVWITPLVVDSTSLQIAGTDQRTAARQALSTAFDDHVKMVNVQLQRGQNDASDVLLIAMETGSAELSWPDGTQFSADLGGVSETADGGFPVTGSPSAPRSEDDALRIATRYAEKRFPWALAASDAKSVPVGGNAESGWVVRWRSRVDGVLMPMRLDVRIDRSGHVAQLLSRRVSGSVSLPPRRVDEKQAGAAVAAYAPGSTPGAGELLAVRREGRWRAQWLVPTSSGSDAYAVYVDAETGKVDERAAPVEELPAAPPSVEAVDVPQE